MIEWPTEINQNILENLLDFKKNIELNCIQQIVEVNNTYNSLLIIYNNTIENINDKISDLKALYTYTIQFNSKNSVCWEVPVCYDDKLAIDINGLANQLGVPRSEIIQRHSSVIYTVYFIGFLPGFLYLGGLDSSLHISRKQTPDLRVKKGAVGIGGKQTGIYPQNSPGGWHIIGNSPIHFFDVKNTQACFAKPGDKIRFKPIDYNAYIEIQTEIDNGEYCLNSCKIDG